MATALDIQGLRKTYSNGFAALKGIDLRVEQGDFFALLGANGAGKSTTIGIVSSLVNKTAGKVSIFGYDIDTQREQARAQIGLVPQEFNFNIFEPVIEIVMNQGGYYGIPRKEAQARAEPLLKQLGLWDKAREQAGKLSGGMKRRLMIARALIHQPRLLILDEPTAGVDIEIRRSMWEFLRKLNADGATIILTTHYLEEAESLCRNIGIIDKGEMIENTSMKKLLNRLDTESYVFDLAEPLASLPATGSNLCHCHLRDPTTLEVSYHKEHYSLNRVFEFLNLHGVEVHSMRNKTNRLEQLFMELLEGNKP
ncbi:ABC transporter ATP-binding protein [Candidatus Thiothrix sp. Deng01]|uniref:ABC transporter ATP-binding protein n=1 Tax=Candidatus Thiothrix phosphatis TaxID=3112415 RepID=A0ABU6CTP0_9GAMM|nr:ABC transporter ATP-binding protein [Candidatus Thiothrix sp. Deng01]MEB4590173.1 ABC transporter ATP-binding protein [Candidatus Thiothrix sp. Deng01]